MKINSILITTLLLSTPAFSQQKHATTYQQQVQQAHSSKSTAAYTSSSTVRFIAELDYLKTSPTVLNQHRSQFLWNTTTATQGTFANLVGFAVGAGYKLGPGFLGIEFGHKTEDLSSTTISPTTTSIKDTFEFEQLNLTYDWVFQSEFEHSYEIGLALGQAIKYRFHNILSSSGVIEDLYWEDTPFVATVKFNYNYHFSDNVRLRLRGDLSRLSYCYL